MEVLGGMYLVVVVFLLILAVQWIALPFAVFGTKDKLNQLITEAKATNAALRELTKEIAAMRKERR